MNVFIDTNVYLSFYHLTNDDLEELRKLAVLIDKGDLKLYVPRQTIDEFRRNRENKIAESLKRLNDQKLKLQFPAFCKDYAEYKELGNLQKELSTHHASLVKQISQDIESNSLKADVVINELFDKAIVIETSEEILRSAIYRMQIGNPPGKNGSNGDAINWEALLSEIADKKPLYLIADDKDYVSALDENKLKEFLLTEWKEVKKSEIHFYRRLSVFFKEHYPDIKLANELEKEVVVQQLASSENFLTTHSAIARLNNFDGFSDAHIVEISNAALTNNQVRWILCDEDVYEFFTSFIERYKDKIEKDSLDAIQARLAQCDDDEDDDDLIPF